MIALAIMAAAAAALPANAAGVATAERNFARRAQNEGQWRAFRATAAPDAIMFTPTATAAATALAGATEPTVPVMWWPATIITACDGSLAVSTGPWVRAASAALGTFTTIWRRTGATYRWQLDHGRPTPRLVAAGDVPSVIAPICAAVSDAAAREASYARLAASVASRAGIEGAAAFGAAAATDVLVQAENAMPARGVAALPRTPFGAALASGHSDDWTLAWAARALASGAPGAHDLRIWQWRGGEGWKLVVYETIGLR